jgi:hypothetical protein
MKIKSPDGKIDPAIVAEHINDEPFMWENYPTIMSWITANRIYLHVAERDRKENSQHSLSYAYGVYGEYDEEILEQIRLAHMGGYFD